jgi:hypothetical protein
MPDKRMLDTRFGLHTEMRERYRAASFLAARLDVAGRHWPTETARRRSGGSRRASGAWLISPVP